MPVCVCGVVKLMCVQDHTDETKPSGFMKRVHTQITPQRQITLAAYLADPSTESTTFTLSAVVVHQGNLSGHYVIYVFREGAWYICSDLSKQLFGKAFSGRSSMLVSQLGSSQEGK